MVSLPHYPKPTQEGLYEHYKAISKAINIPIFIYSWFGQYGIEIEMETLVRLAQDGYIQGIKYSTPDVGKIAEIVRLTEGKITVMPGVEILLLTALLLGADGCLGATLELVPEETVKVYNLFNEGKITEAAKQQAKIMPLFNALTHNDTRDDVPLMKEGLKMLGQDLGESPLPATKVPPDAKEKLRQELSKLGKL